MGKADLVWLIIRARLGRKHAISIDAIAAVCDCTINEAKSHIKSLRDSGVRIAYSARTPQGYFIPTPDDEMDQNDTLKASISAVASLIVRAMLIRRISLGVIMYEIEGVISGLLTGPLAPLKKALPPPASQKQITHLSHLALSSLLDQDERDTAYQLMSSVSLSKDAAHDTISDIRARIEKREQNRVDSKRARMAFRDIHHPEKPTETLIRRDKSRVQQTWNKSQEPPEKEDPDGTDDDRV